MDENSFSTSSFSTDAWEFFLGVVVAALKYWNGSSWIAKTIKEWDGSAWQTKTLKRWDGSTWI